MKIKTENIELNKQEIKLVAIGVSTGGPAILQIILSNLQENFPPILIVQHISVGFLSTMLEWLAKSTGKNIVIAQDGEMLVRNRIYFAPDNYHLGVTKKGTIFLSQADAENSVKPAVSFLFRTINEAYGDKVIAILLTGMGHDGVIELKKLKEKGAITIVQDRSSSVVHGMAGEAINQKAVQYILTPIQIAEFINNKGRI